MKGSREETKVIAKDEPHIPLAEFHEPDARLRGTGPGVHRASCGVVAADQTGEACSRSTVLRSRRGLSTGVVMQDLRNFTSH